MWIPGYRIVRTLGEGGMATVYLAIQENFQREVALKIMSPLLARGDSSFGERFLREARIVAQLNHPHIVAVYDVGVHDSQHYLAMEYVPGNDLKNRRFELPMKLALGAVKQVALALDYAHKKGYVHRDIKPENVLLNDDGSRAVLTDFGIARPSGTEGGLTQTGTAIGTPSYMSPEQALGKPLDHRTDLYSLGVVLYYLLIGDVPFTADSAVAIGIKHAVEPIPRLPGPLISFQLCIDKAMAKAADKRYQSGAEFADAIDALIASLSPELEIAWRAQLKATASENKPVAAATVISGANPTAVPVGAKTPAPASTIAPARQPTPAREPALVADAADRLGGPSLTPIRVTTPSPRVVSQPAKSSNAPLLLTLLVLLGSGAGGWYWYQLQQQRVAPTTSAATDPSLVPPTTTTPAAAASTEATPAGDATDVAPGTLADSTPPTTSDSTIGPLADTGGAPPAIEGAVTDRGTESVTAEPSATEPSSTELGSTEPGTKTVTPAVGDNTPTSPAQTDPNQPSTSPSTASQPPATTTEPAVTEPAAPAIDPKAAQIQQLLADADQRLKSGKLIEPANDSAEALYGKVLKLDSKNAAAKDGKKNVGLALARQGMAAVNAGDGLRATMLYERAVVLAPRTRDVNLLKQRLDQMRRVEQAQPLLQRADKLLAAGKLITPANDNAYDLYKQAQSVDPISTLALKGLSEVEVKLADEIERLWRRKQYTEASSLYAGAKERYPDSKDINDVGKATVLSASHKPKPAETLDAELLRPEILSLRVSGNPLNSLPPEQATILVIGTSLHAAFTYQNFKPGATVIEAQLYDDSHQIKLESKALTLNYDAGELRFQLDRPVEGFPDGDYFLDLYAKGERLTSLQFKVQRADLF